MLSFHELLFEKILKTAKWVIPHCRSAEGVDSSLLGLPEAPAWRRVVTSFADLCSLAPYEGRAGTIGCGWQSQQLHLRTYFAVFKAIPRKKHVAD